MNKKDKLIEYLLKHIEHFDYFDRLGMSPNLPNFDLSAYDYLAKCEELMNKIKTGKGDSFTQSELIDYLKKAFECQIDTFFHNCNIDYKKLKVPDKIKVLELINIFGSSGLISINTIRNKIQHHYQHSTLDIQELTLYYDLIKGVIFYLQSMILLVSHYREINFESNEGIVSFKLSDDSPKICFDLPYNNSSEKLEAIYQRGKHIDYDELFFLKAYLVLMQFEAFKDKNIIINLIKG